MAYRFKVDPKSEKITAEDSDPSTSLRVKKSGAETKPKPNCLTSLIIPPENQVPSIKYQVQKRYCPVEGCGWELVPGCCGKMVCSNPGCEYEEKR